MLFGILRMGFDDAGQSRDAQVFEIMGSGIEETGYGFGCRIEEGGIGIKRCDGPYAFVYDGVSRVDADIGPFHAFGEHFVGVFAGGSIVFAECAEDAYDLHLHPWCGHAMVIEVAGETMFHDLFEYGYEGGYEISKGCGIGMTHGVHGVQTASHHGRIAIAQCSTQFLNHGGFVHSIGRYLMESMQGQYGLLTNLFVLVFDEFDHLIGYGGNHVRRDDVGHRHEGRAAFENMTAR
mmetsp:Transcript_7544/g.10795  ORF Transcript_7544/g.10795 Transcript_7544/m.10795 type:complete len:235 (-) Transcript_7544:172-876(-)